ncbi:unnamed protein product (macronuclear) [Paramecium tetraurelia]|uniref:N-end aminoacyl transferase N-terminal domain-containing protein n=1 Tax=Paramecium tetraurelia TaxID=5888 RepID=A0DLH6_PARTE|nr:uncharacterized protein GSPATT00018210001 [Paramecium tetraurelia]CAK83893.1 unnamed protein product [Paramecium tetraurelia]|eukprot:XP_001451290.1 hypothetical protein (macronuclear) [Paramecium tetraurelia strain d4-2]
MIASIDIKTVNIEQQGFCLSCKKLTANGTVLQIQNFDDTLYSQLQDYSWRKSGQQFYHSNPKSCCQQVVCKISALQYNSPKRCIKALRKITQEHFDFEPIKQSIYNNLLQYVDLSRPCRETLQTRQAFQDFLLVLSQRLDFTSLNKFGFKEHPHDELKKHVGSLNTELHMDVKVDKQNQLHFKWPSDFVALLKKQKKSSLIVIAKPATYDQEAHQLFNDTYFQVSKQSYEKMFCDSQSQMIKYYAYSQLAGVSFVELRSNSFHRLSFHYTQQIKEINRIAMDYEIKWAQQLNLQNYYYVKKSSRSVDNQVINQTIDNNFPIVRGQKMIQIKQLRSVYQKYLIELLTKMNSVMGPQLFKLFIYKYD